MLIVLQIIITIVLFSTTKTVSAQLSRADDDSCKTHCSISYTASPQCLADPACFWSDFTDSCLTRCALISDRRACGGAATEYLPDSSHCFWRNTTARCEPKCSRLTRVADCNAFPHCVLLSDEDRNLQTTSSSSSTAAVITTNRCAPRCTEISYTILDDIPMTQLPLEVTRTTSELFDLCLAESDGECILDYSTSLCVRTCTAQYGLCLTPREVSNCNADSRCRFDVSTGNCVERCDVFTNDVSCTLFGAYSYNLHSSATTPSALTSPSSLSTACWWNSRFSSCDNNCEFNFRPSSSSTSLSENVESVLLSCNSLTKDCFYHNTKNLCVAKCSRFEANATQCLSNSHCIALSSDTSRENRGCVTKCSDVYDSSSTSSTSSTLSGDTSPIAKRTCSLDSSCVWVESSIIDAKDPAVTSGLFSTALASATAELGCLQRCSLYQDDFQCTQDPSCVYFSSSRFTGCTTKCQLRFSPSSIGTTSTLCNSNPLCQYINDKIKCRDRCSLLGQYSCGQTPTCTWLGASRKCVLRCSVFDQQSQCTAAVTDRNELFCQLITSPAVISQSVSTATTLITTCQNQCNLYESATECNAQNHCEYSSASSLCSPRCSFYSQYDPSTFGSSLCATTPGCYVAPETGECLRQCSSFTSGVAGDCLTNQHCVESAAASSTSSSSSTTTTTTTTCVSKCSFLYSSSSSCTSDSVCTYSSQLGCVNKCSFITLASSCNSASASADVVGCTWLNGACITECSLRYSFESECLADATSASPHCSWTDYVGCYTSCSMYSYSPSSSSSQQQQICSSSGNCNWNVVTSTCQDKCENFDSSQTLCSSKSFCVWTGGSCRELCSTAPTTTICGNPTSEYSHCILDTASSGVCISSCETFLTLSSCTHQSASCVWLQTVSKCHPSTLCSSSSSSKSDCKLKSLCQYYSRLQSCEFSCGMRHCNSSIDTCNADPVCEYFTSFGMCSERCSTLSSEDCNLASHICTWDASSATCFVASCANRVPPSIVSTTTAAERSQYCSFDRECFLEQDTTSCRRNCSSQVLSFSSTMCETQTHCFWDYLGSTSSSTTSTSMKYCHIKCSVAATSIYGGECPVSPTNYLCDSILVSSPPTTTLVTYICIESCLTKSESACNLDPRCAWRTSPFYTGASVVSTSSPLQKASCGYANTCLQGTYSVSLPSLQLNTCSHKNTLCKHFWGAQCGMNCHRFSSSGPEACLAAAVEGNCVWNEANSSCIPSCYHRTTNLDFCYLDNQCFFSFATATCHDRCSIVHRPQSAVNDEEEDIAGYCNSSGTTTSTHFVTTLPTTWNYCYYDSTHQSCRETCKKRFTNNQQMCEAKNTVFVHDLQCVWNYKTGECTSDCSMASLASSRQLCLTTSLSRDTTCFWTGSTCVVQCSSVYANITQCNANPACDYGFAGRGGCEQNCASLCPETCRATSYCEYNATTGVCSRNCSASFPFSSTDCNAHTACVWDVKNAVCRDRCSRSSNSKFDCISHPKYSQHCIWTGVACTESCGALFTAATCPTSHGECEIVNSVNCLDPCNKFLTIGAVDGDLIGYCPSTRSVGCTLYTSSTCSRTCELLPATSCSSQNQFCFLTAGVCKMRCRYATTASECSARSEYCDYFGVWTGVGSCVDNCLSLSLSELSCSQNNQCVWRNSGCYPICSLLSKQRCLNMQTATAGCEWNYYLNICENSCSVFYSSNETLCKSATSTLTSTSSSSTSTTTLCTWVSTTNTCQVSCERFASLSSCSQFSSVCFWSISARKCLLRCDVKYPPSSASSASLCVADPTCTYVSSSLTSTTFCMNSCFHYSTADACRSSLVTHSSSNASYCTWSSIRQKCLLDCSFSSNSLSSTASPMCNQHYCEPIFNNNVSIGCKPKCSLYSGLSTECLLPSSSCVSTATTLCLRNCSTKYPFLENKTACITDPSKNCMWDYARQTCQNACNVFKSQQTCEDVFKNNRQCVWYQNSCVQSCESKYGGGKDFFNSTTNITTVTPYTPSECSSVLESPTGRCMPSPFVVSATSSCTDACHIFSSSQTRCASRPINCVWNSALSTCQTRCNAPIFSSSKQVCINGNPECDWFGGTCLFACSNFAANETECNQHEYCQWMTSNMNNNNYSTTTTGSQCVKKCSLLYNSSSSSSLSDHYLCESEPHCSMRNQLANSSAVCQLSCALFGASKQICETESNCIWLGAQQQCVSKCSGRTMHTSSSSSSSLSPQMTLSFCSQDSNCNFIIQSSSCEMNCTGYDFAQCTSSTNINNVLNLCMWDDQKNLCRQSCQYLYRHDKASCESSSDQHMCSWNDLKKRCVVKCHTTSTTTEQMQYDWSGNALEETIPQTLKSGASQCVGVSSAGSCRWLMKRTFSRDDEQGLDKTQIEFVSYGWEEGESSLDSTVDGDNRAFGRDFLGYTAEKSLSQIVSSKSAGASNTTLVRLSFDSSYDDAVRAHDKVSQLTFSGKRDLRRRMGVLNPRVVGSAAKVGGNFLFLLFFLEFFMLFTGL